MTTTLTGTPARPLRTRPATPPVTPVPPPTAADGRPARDGPAGAGSRALQRFGEPGARRAARRGRSTRAPHPGATTATRSAPVGRISRAGCRGGARWDAPAHAAFPLAGRRSLRLAVTTRRARRADLGAAATPPGGNDPASAGLRDSRRGAGGHRRRP